MCSNHSNKNPQEIYGVSFCGNKLLGLSFSTQHLVKVFFLSLLGEFWCDVFLLGFRAPKKANHDPWQRTKKNTWKKTKCKSRWWFQLCFCSHKHGEMIQFNLRIFTKWVGGFNHLLPQPSPSLFARAPPALNFEAPAPEESSRGSLQLPKVRSVGWKTGDGELRVEIMCIHIIFICIVYIYNAYMKRQLYI